MNFSIRGLSTDKAAEFGDLNLDFSLKSIFNPEFSLVDLDLLETLGTGTFGRVRLVKSLIDRKFYALKMMKKARIVKLQQLEHIQNEVRILSRLRCRFVNELFAVWADDNSLYLLLEYIPGGELFSHLRRQGKFDLPQYLFYTVEVICALQHIHALNIVYRDIKPENILIHSNGHIILSDFGFSKIIDDIQQTFTLCGTPEYLAPEVIEGKGYGLAIDFWALGVLLFEMAAGYPPFYGDNPFEVYRKILAAKVNFPSSSSGASIPSAARSAISSFLTVSRSSRLGCGSGGFRSIKTHQFFRGIEWTSASQCLIMPPTVPTVLSAGDTSNFDLYPDEAIEESTNLTFEERQMFAEFDRILERPVRL